MSREAINDLVDRLAEGELDDLGDMKELDTAPTEWASGTRVRITKGNYEGELGTVVAKGHVGNNEWGYWVHPDGSDDPNDQILYPITSLEVVFNAHPPGTKVKILQGPFTGQVGYITGTNRTRGVVYVHPEGVEDHENPETNWATYQMPIQSVEVVESDKVEHIVDRVLETVEDQDDMKELDMWPIERRCAEALAAAGFNVTEATKHEDEVLLKMTWPTPRVAIAVNGVKRIREVLQPILGEVRNSDFRVERKGETTELLVRKRILDDPELWKMKRVLPHGQAGENPFEAFHPAWYQFLFNDRPMGRAWCKEGEHTADYILKEMSWLHQIFPFHPQGWNQPGNSFGEGPAIYWWRTNRYRLGPRADQDTLAARFELPLLSTIHT